MKISMTMLLFLFMLPQSVFPSKENKKCLREKDYTSCHLGSSCNSYDANPCGCPNACCAPDHFLGKRTFNHALPFLYGYRCYKKLTCGQVCGSNSRCGCADGLTCVREKHTKIRRCKALLKST